MGRGGIALSLLNSIKSQTFREIISFRGNVSALSYPLNSTLWSITLITDTICILEKKNIHKITTIKANKLPLDSINLQIAICICILSECNSAQLSYELYTSLVLSSQRLKNLFFFFSNIFQHSVTITQNHYRLYHN